MGRTSATKRGGSDDAGVKISVLTVAKNSRSTIRYTLDSFFAQDHPDKELVVVDGASTDGTLEIVRSYPQDEIRLVSEPDAGMYDAINKAMRLYTGDAFGILNSDDTYRDRTVLSRIADGLEEADIVYGHLDFVESHGTKKTVRRWRAEPRPQKGFRTGWMPPHPTFYVSRAVADKVGQFDLSLVTAADYDWMLRAVDVHAFKTALIDHVLIDMLTGGRSTASLGAHLRHNWEALQARRHWLRAGFVDYALIAKPARKFGQFAHRNVIGRKQQPTRG